MQGEIGIKRFSKSMVAVQGVVGPRVLAKAHGKGKNSISGKIYSKTGNEENFVFFSLDPVCPGSLALET